MNPRYSRDWREEEEDEDEFEMSMELRKILQEYKEIKRKDRERVGESF